MINNKRTGLHKCANLVSKKGHIYLTIALCIKITAVFILYNTFLQRMFLKNILQFKSIFVNKLWSQNLKINKIGKIQQINHHYFY